MDEWVKIMEREIIPFQVSKGMVICGSFGRDRRFRLLYGCAASRAKPSARRSTKAFYDRLLEDQNSAARAELSRPWPPWW